MRKIRARIGVRNRNTTARFIFFPLLKLFHYGSAIPGDHLIDSLRIRFCFNSLSGCFFNGIQDKQDFCFRRHSIPFVRIVPQIDNQAAERSSELLQCKRTTILLQESLDLGLFSSPAAPQLIESQRTCIFAVLDHRRKNRKRMTGSLYTVWHQGTSHASDSSNILFPTANFSVIHLGIQINPYPSVA